MPLSRNMSKSTQKIRFGHHIAVYQFVGLCFVLLFALLILQYIPCMQLGVAFLLAGVFLVVERVLSSSQIVTDAHVL